MKLARWKVSLGIVCLIAALSVPASSANSDKRSAMPGTLNYVEGQASIGNQTLDSKAIGSVELQAGQILTTENGKAEVLLTPGVFLRLGSNSSVKMISPDLTNTQLALKQGEAMLEVDEIHSQNDIRVSQPGANSRVLKTGLYNFDATKNECTGGVACDRSICPRQTWKVHECTSRMDGMDRAGSAQDGTGIRGLADSRSCRQTASSIVRSVGAFTRRW